MSNDVKDRGLTGAILDELWPILGGSHTAASVWTEIEEALSPVIARHQLQREAVLEQAAAKALKHAANKIDEMMPPEQQSNGWKLGFYRMRKNAKDLLLGHARAYWASALEGGSAVGAGRLDHPLRHPAEASLTTPATAVSRDEALIRRIEYILDPTASAAERTSRRAHLTNHDLRTILSRLADV